MFTLEIEHTLVLSTGHVTVGTARTLNGSDAHDYRDGGVECIRAPWKPHIVYQYGWIFYAKQDMALVDYPAEFAAIFALARQHDCTWVRFDCDGPQIEGLPFYDW